MAIVKKAIKAPTVIVETKKMTSKDVCGIKCCGNMKYLVVPVLLLINTILIVRVLLQQVNMEANKIGGRDNYGKVQQIYKSEVFKAQQTQQIEQALQQYQQAAQAPQTVPTAENNQVQPSAEAPVVTPTVTK